MEALDTFPKLLINNYKKYGSNRVALRHKKFGIWHKYTWEDYYDNVRCIAFGLKKMGLEIGEKVAIIGDNYPLWYWTELAVQAAGGVTVGICADCRAIEVKFFLEHSDSKFVFAENQEQVDKILEVLGELSNIKKVIYWSDKGLCSYKEAALMDVKNLMQTGSQYEKDCSIGFEEIVEHGDGEDIALISYTSGSTGLPKGAMFSHKTYIDIARSINETDPVHEHDNYVSFISPAWAEEQVGGVARQLITGMVVNFPESPNTVRKDLREIAPQIVSYSPRIWEGIHSNIQATMDDAKGLRKLAVRTFLPIGYRKIKYLLDKRSIPIVVKCLYSIADCLLFRGFKKEYGLIRARIAYAGGGLISRDIISFFLGIGVNIRKVYGLTEFPYIACHRNRDVKNNTCGPPLPHWEQVKIDHGTILVKGKGSFKGYYKDPERGAKMFQNGWGITEDAGEIDQNGHLVVYGSLLDFRELRGGKKFCPEYLEAQLRFSSYIKDCIVIGGIEREYVSAMIVIDFVNVGSWARRNHINYTTFLDLSRSSSVYDLIQKEIESVNNTLPSWSRIGKYLLLHKELDPDEGELTRSGRLRRFFVEKRYSEIIEAIYRDEKEFVIKRKISYQEASQEPLGNSIKIREI